MRSSSPADSPATAGIERRVEEILRQQMFREVPARDADLFASGVLDSLSLVDLIARLEAAFGREISLADVELDDLRTLGGIARMMAAERNGG
jgi:acyl carrier protein